MAPRHDTYFDTDRREFWFLTYPTQLRVMSRPAKRVATGSRYHRFLSVLTWISPITDFFSRSSTSKPYGAEAYGALSRNLTNQTTNNTPISSDEVSKLSRSGDKRRRRQGNIVFDCITVMSPSTEDVFLSSVDDSQPRDNDVTLLFRKWNWQ